MPELPEVETICRGLREKILKKRISSLEIFKTQLIKSDPAELVDFLVGKKIKNISRRGKLIIFEIADKFLLIHLRMTGQLIYCLNKVCIGGGHTFNSSSDLKKNSCTVFEIKFFDGAKLLFNDLRQFALVKLVEKNELEIIKNKFGIEPLTPNFTWENFKELFQGSSRLKIKTLLLDQTKIAGLGNIYADEVCFFAGVNPERKIGTITEEEKKKIFIGSEEILKQAILQKGTTFRNFLDSEGKIGNFSDHLKVYGRAGKICLSCGKLKIVKIKLNGRGTHFCPFCQK